MPPLVEGDLLYMPSALPGLSADKASQLLQQTDKVLMQFPEVERVFGQEGWAVLKPQLMYGRGSGCSRPPG